MEKSLAKVNTRATAVQRRNEEILIKEHSALDSRAVWANQVERRQLNNSMAQLNLQHSFNKSYLNQRRMSSVGHLQKLQLQREATQAGPTLDKVIHARIQKREMREQMKKSSAQSRRRELAAMRSSPRGFSPVRDEEQRRRELEVMTPDNLRARASSRAGKERSAWELRQMVDVDRIVKTELEKKRQKDREERNAQFQEYKKAERAKLDDKVNQFLKRVDNKPGVDRKRRQSQVMMLGQVRQERRTSIAKGDERNSTVKNERRPNVVKSAGRQSLTNNERRPSVAIQGKPPPATASGRRQSQVLWQRRMSVVDVE
ncbi:uncharacterized protein [Ptychodera flava]|uniref:uncharacterized protein n=1 Tax=Ptychodera flava TaxID=63121 RepID=UPI00396AAC96